MSKKDGKDCKHEELWIRCNNGECDYEIEVENVVIRTKAYDQAREDVIEAGKSAIKHSRSDRYWDELKKLEKALDALGGE